MDTMLAASTKPSALLQQAHRQKLSLHTRLPDLLECQLAAMEMMPRGSDHPRWTARPSSGITASPAAFSWRCPLTRQAHAHRKLNTCSNTTYSITLLFFPCDVYKFIWQVLEGKELFLSNIDTLHFYPQKKSCFGLFIPTQLLSKYWCPQTNQQPCHGFQKISVGEELVQNTKHFISWRTEKEKGIVKRKPQKGTV